MSRILDYVLEPSVVYTNGSFLVKVKVQDDYKYKKLLVSENMKYTTATGTTYTLTNAVSTNNASILQLQGNTTQNGTPTPTNPIPIYTVSGDNEVVVCGENRFNKSVSPCYTFNTTWTELDTGVRATLTSAGNNRYMAIKLIAEQLLGKTITVSATMTPSGTNNGLIKMYWLNGNSLTNKIGNNITATGSLSYTIPSAFPSGSNGIAIVFSSNNNGTSQVNDYVDYTNVQIEEGSTATPYSPHTGNSYRVDFGNYELCKIGNYVDKLFKAEEGNDKYDSLDSTTKASLTYGNWYIEKNIGKVVLDGNTTGWSGGIVATDVYRFYRPIEGIKARTENTRYIDRFITDRFKLSTNNEYGASYQYHNNLYFCVSSNEATTGDSFKTWLSTHNITIYYVLSTPTYETITNENLIQQLNNIQDIELIENLCYVDWVGEEKPTMTLQYPTNETLNAYITTEDNKLIRTDWGV